MPQTIDLPGDIVECGVFKGAGLAQWAKFLQIHCPGSLKYVVFPSLYYVG